MKDKLLLGELTFYPAGGHSKFEPKEWDYKFGEMVDLDKIPREHLSKEWIDILETRPDQTRPDQTRPDLICKGYIYIKNNIIIIDKLQPISKFKYIA